MNNDLGIKFIYNFKIIFNLSPFVILTIIKISVNYMFTRIVGSGAEHNFTKRGKKILLTNTNQSIS